MAERTRPPCRMTIRRQRVVQGCGQHVHTRVASAGRRMSRSRAIRLFPVASSGADSLAYALLEQGGQLNTSVAMSMEPCRTNLRTPQKAKPVLGVVAPIASPPAKADSCGELVATSVSHVGRVFLDRVGRDLFQLTDIVTQERHMLPPGEWELHLDDDTQRYAALRTDVEGESFLLVEETCCFDVFETPGKDTYIAFGSSDVGGQHLSLEAWRSKCSSAQVSLHVGSLGTEQRFEVFVVKRPRAGGCRIFWAMYELYDIMKLTIWRGQRSKWAYNGLPQWRRFLEERFSQDLFIQSKHASSSKVKSESVPFSDRMLPQLSGNTVAIVALLSRWGFAAADKGGMKSPENQKACADILQALMGLCYPEGFECEVGIVFDQA